MLPPFGRYTFAWGSVLVRPLLNEQDHVVQHRQVRAAWWICGLVRVRFEVDGHQWSLPAVPAELFKGGLLLRRAALDRSDMVIAAKNAAVLHGLWQATQAAAKFGEDAFAAITRTKGERVLQPVLVGSTTEDPPPPPKTA